MKRKKFNRKNKKEFVQPKLTAVPMTETELPGMPEAPPKPPEARISEAQQFAISECAIDCANDPKALEIFLEELTEAMYYAKRKPLAIIMISHQDNGINCGLTLLPEASNNMPLDPTHALALEAFGELAGLIKLLPRECPTKSEASFNRLKHCRRCGKIRKINSEGICQKCCITMGKYYG